MCAFINLFLDSVKTAALFFFFFCSSSSSSSITMASSNFYYIIAFIVIYVLLSRFLYDPLMNVLRNRRTRIEKQLEDSAVAANARRNAEVEAEKLAAQARVDAQRGERQASDGAGRAQGAL